MDIDNKEPEHGSAKSHWHFTPKKRKMSHGINDNALSVKDCIKLFRSLATNESTSTLSEINAKLSAHHVEDQINLETEVQSLRERIKTLETRASQNNEKQQSSFTSYDNNTAFLTVSNKTKNVNGVYTGDDTHLEIDGIQDEGSKIQALERELKKSKQANLAFQNTLREIGEIVTAGELE